MGLTEEEAIREAQRCLGLRTCESCETCSLLCPDLCITRNEKTGEVEIDLDYCKGCGICSVVCPKGSHSDGMGGGGMSKKIRIDLNSDVGESFGAYKIGLDEEVIPHITSANIACGFHGGDPEVMRKTLALARKFGVEAGAHPGFPDLMGFGRRNMDATLDEIQDYVVYQTGALQAFARAQGMKLQHVKPHGALYNMAAANPKIWDAIAEAVAKVDRELILVALASAGRDVLTETGKRHGIRFARNPKFKTNSNDQNLEFEII